VIARSLEECPSSNPNRDGLGDVTKTGLSVEALLEDSITARKLEDDVKGLLIQSWNEEVSALTSH
jgi:hypothetical protein